MTEKNVSADISARHFDGEATAEPNVAEGTDWMWCYENPREAAAEIDRLSALSQQAGQTYCDIHCQKLCQNSAAAEAPKGE